MRKLVLFKAAADEWSRAFSERGYDVVFVEPLQFEFRALEQLRERLTGEYAALVATSPRAVDALALCWGDDSEGRWRRRRLYAVGAASAGKALQRLRLEARGGHAGSADALAQVILQESAPGERLLFPCGNLRSEAILDTLTGGGLQVDALTVYHTKENSELKPSLLELNASGKDLCGMVFFSPSGCEYVYRQLQTFNNRLSVLPHFAIGNSTAHRIVNLGLDVAGVAEQPRPLSLLSTVDDYFSRAEAQG